MREDIFENQSIPFETAKILVAGVGGGGCNAIRHMVLEKITGVHFLCVNTDVKDLSKVQGQQHLPIGKRLTKGLGAGGDPVRGREAAMEDREDIRASLEGADMLFITAGLGGGTGTGAAPVIAEAAKELGILTVAVVTKPFKFEGNRRNEIASKGLEQLHNSVDALIVIPNDRLLEKYGQGMKVLDAFAAVNNVLLNAVRGIANLITCPGEINVDFADVKSVMSDMGMSMMGTGYSSEEGAAIKAVEQAIASPLLDNVQLQGAKGILVNVTGNDNLTLNDFQQVCDRMHECASPDSRIITGMTIEEGMEDAIRVTIVASGIDKAKPDFNIHKSDNLVVNDTVNEPDSESLMDVPTFLRRQMD